MKMGKKHVVKYNNLMKTATVPLLVEGICRAQVAYVMLLRAKKDLRAILPQECV